MPRWMPTQRVGKRSHTHTCRCNTWLLPILAVPLVLRVTQRCWLGPFATPSLPQASRDADSLEHHGSRRAGLFSAAAAVISAEVGVPAGIAQDAPQSVAQSTKPRQSQGDGRGLFKYSRWGGFQNADPNQLASRVTKEPPDPEGCQGADDGDLVGINYVAAYEVPAMKGATVDTDIEASIDLLEDEDTKAAVARWNVFDSSERRRGRTPLQIPLGDNNVDLGLEMALHGLCRGERRVIYFPASMSSKSTKRAYDVPGDANLRYDVEVTNVITFQRPRAKQGMPPEPRRVVGRLLN
mmetsp:Transcript_112656/g.224044  ORF Transcript_112656/g.224044 Transcript_112656/m.224044 type:complete len:295 (-) Transcript_112656:229-1113(-)